MPGGHLDFGESFERCAVREVLEETGLSVNADSIQFLTATNDIMTSENKHYITIFVRCTLHAMVLEGDTEFKPKVNYQQLFGLLQGSFFSGSRMTLTKRLVDRSWSRISVRYGSG